MEITSLKCKIVLNLALPYWDFTTLSLIPLGLKYRLWRPSVLAKKEKEKTSPLCVQSRYLCSWVGLHSIEILGFYSLIPLLFNPPN